MLCLGKEVTSPLNFHLEQYEGPLDLLLDLIRKQKINIYDIPIAQITAQYLDYMQRAVALDIELSSDFVYMSATLIHIKSRLLLPRDPELDRIAPEEDPRQELVERLIEHERFKNAAEMLQQKRLVEEAVWSNPQIAEFLTDEPPGLTVTIFDLVKTLGSILERAKNRPVYEVGKEAVSIPDMIRFLCDQLQHRRQGLEGLSATELFDRQGSRRAMICLFLAILELVKRHGVELVQGEAFGDITLRRGSEFSALEDTADLATVEQEYQ